MAAVQCSGAEVGVMLDTDVDRCGLIDGMRSPPEPVHKNRLIALCARVALEDAGGRGVIVTDPVTSAGMGKYIAKYGGEHDRFKMGYRNVIDRAAETQPEPALLAIETSGHSAWKVRRSLSDHLSPYCFQISSFHLILKSRHFLAKPVTRIYFDSLLFLGQCIRR